MRCREVKLWDRRALNSSIGSQSLSMSSGWVLWPQPSEMVALTTMRISVWQWEDGRSNKKQVLCVWYVDVDVEVDMKWGAATAYGFLLSSWLTWQRFDTVPPHSRVRDTCSVSARKKKRLHHTSIISAKGQAAVNASAHLSSLLLLVVLCSWPFLLSLFFQTRLPEGQWKAETWLSQERWGIEGWKWNKDGRSEFSFRSLCIFNTVYDSNPALSTDVGWFSTMWWIQLFLFQYFHQRVLPRLTLLHFSYSYIKICQQIFHRQVFMSQIPCWFRARTQKCDHKQCQHL